MSERLGKVGFVLVSTLLLAVLGLLFSHACMIRMPGKTHTGELEPLSTAEGQTRAALERHVRFLSEQVGERQLAGRHSQLERAASYIEADLEDAGYDVESEWFEVDGKRVRNLIATLAGRDDDPETDGEIVVIGAHYDTAEGTPGANDNGSGTAALLEIARAMQKDEPQRTVRFVAFTNEEPPWFQTENMGSLQYARGCRERGDDVVAMLSLETIGYYSDESGSQMYPAPLDALYPDRGNFVAFVGNAGSSRYAITAPHFSLGPQGG